MHRIWKHCIKPVISEISEDTVLKSKNYAEKSCHEVFMWFALKPVTAVNNFADNVWKNIGIAFTMAAARMFSWFDKEGIDWVIDGSAKSVVDGGNQIRHVETGRIQQYIGFAVAMIFIVIIAVVFNF